MKLRVLFGFGFMILLVYSLWLIGSKEGTIDMIHKSSGYFNRFSDTKRKTDNLSVDDSHSPAESLGNQHCPKTDNHSLYIHLKARNGRTGSTLFQIYCLLALTNKFCYKATIDPRRAPIWRSIQPFFDMTNIELDETVNPDTFQPLSNVLSRETQEKLTLHLNNWTLEDICYGYNYFVGQEQYIRSSVKIKESINHVVEEYMSTFFVNRSTVAIHVRRTDRVDFPFKDDYQYKSLDWYIPYISNAMAYLRKRYSDLTFIFVSDDMKWCETNFYGEGVYFSPFLSAGYDLALIARCDHMIFTIGGFAWHGAWLGKKKTVIYSKQYLPQKYKNFVFVYPWWTGL